MLSNGPDEKGVSYKNVNAANKKLVIPLGMTKECATGMYVGRQV